MAGDSDLPTPGSHFLLFFPRDAITKMKDVYLKNPQMGDPASLDHKLTEVSQNIEKLRLEAQKFEVWESCRGGRKQQQGRVLWRSVCLQSLGTSVPGTETTGDAGCLPLR